jgi:ketosteroid isomerase-like protein
MQRKVIAIVGCIVFVCTSVVALAEPTDANLRSELETLHAKWFKAFDGGDGATMDQMEMDNLTLVLPTGVVWSKTSARAGKQAKGDPQTERTLASVSVRRFGDTAILAGTLNTRSAKEKSQDGTIVVFVQSSGKWKIASAQWTPAVGTK